MCKLSGTGNTRMNKTCLLPSKSREDRKLNDRKLTTRRSELLWNESGQKETEGVIPGPGTWLGVRGQRCR